MLSTLNLMLILFTFSSIIINKLSEITHFKIHIVFRYINVFTSTVAARIFEYM